MFFDDRLATVLRQRGDSEAGARTQFRQLLDILGNRKFAPDDPHGRSMIAAAWLRMDALAQRIPAAERAEMIRERSWRLRSADLTAHLADFEPEVASAALTRAELSVEDWSALIPRLPVRARGFMRLRRDLPMDTVALLDRLGIYDRGLPSPEDKLPRAADPTVVQATLPDPDDAVPGYDADPIAARIHQPKTKTEPAQESTPAPTPAPAPALADTGRSEISALVERIAQFRRTREAEAVESDLAPRLPLNDDLPANDRHIAIFGFAADAAGRIEWADAKVAPSVIGTRLVTPRVIGSDSAEADISYAYTRRLPIIQSEFELSGAASLTGMWIVDARPRFTDDGNFCGYVGRFRRPASTSGEANGPAAREADRIRQLLHELRTPVTAIQGYAEVIQQQLFGPAPHEYRAMAASIAADAAHILSGFAELDRLARLEASVAEMEEGSADLAAITARMVAQLTPVLAPRMAGLEFALGDLASLVIALEPEEAEALIWRVLATCGGGCASGEVLRIDLTREGNLARLACDIPAQLLSEEDIFAADAKPIAANINAGVFGAGFALRLARAEARAAGGRLSIDGERVTLMLPLLTGADALPSQGKGS